MSVHATDQLESGRANDTAKIWYEELCADDSDWESKVLQFFQYIQTQVEDIAEYMRKKPNYKELCGSYKVLSETLSILIEREITDFSFYEEMLNTVGLVPGDFWGDYAEEAYEKAGITARYIFNELLKEKITPTNIFYAGKKYNMETDNPLMIALFVKNYVAASRIELTGYPDKDGGKIVVTITA